MTALNPDFFQNLGHMGLIAILLAILFVVAARFRPYWGITPTAVFAGLLQVPQTVLAPGLSIPVIPNVLVSPASVVFFPATLFAVLLVYVLEDELETKRLVYGLVLANVALALLLLISGPLLHSSGAAQSPAMLMATSPSFFFKLLVGAVLLGIDALILVKAFEWFGERVSRNLLSRVFLALGTTVAFDGIAFSIIAYSGRPHFLANFAVALAGKLLAALFYSLAFVFLLRWALSPVDKDASVIRLKRSPGSVTYKDRFRDLQQVAVRDALTGVFNRAYFDHELRSQTERALVRGEPLLLLLIDLDKFKTINDTYGHPTGDRVLTLFGEALRAVARSNDTVCRYGGEEFAMLIGGGPTSIAGKIFERTVEEVSRLWGVANPPFPFPAPKFSMGGAAVPADATVAHEVLSIADNRLYKSKGGGGDRLTVS